jgi:protein-S-isoprenylcysteine O-methyltransferase Ste14
MPASIASRLWVAAQFGVIAAMLACPAHWQPLRAAPLALAVAALALAAWVFAYNRPGNFNVRPEPKDGARLVTGGPYRLVRHPMYSALLLGCAALAAAAPDAPRLLGWLALLLVLRGKSALEERLLLQRWPQDYAAYRATTRRFVPWLW